MTAAALMHASRPDPRREEFRRLEHEAKEQVSAELLAAEQEPLAYGDVVAWVDRRYSLTDSLTPVHRVAIPTGQEPKTFCDEVIPPPTLRFGSATLTPRLVESLGRCRWCEHGYALDQRARDS